MYNFPTVDIRASSFVSGIALCNPNPCENNGICQIVSRHSFLCQCNETFYTGDRCQSGIIRLPVFPRLEVGARSYLLTIEAKVRENLVIVPVPSNKKLIVQPQAIEIAYPLTSSQFRLIPKDSGFVEISYVLSGPDKYFFTEPENSMLYITDPKTERNLSFIPSISFMNGHCYENVVGSCHSGNKITVASSCPWTSNATKGYQSVMGGKLHLPFSVSGLNLTKNTNFQRTGVVTAYRETISMLKHGMKACNDGKSCVPNTPMRYEKLEHKYLIELNLFIRNYLRMVSHAAPWWFHMELPFRYDGFHIDNIQSLLIKGEFANKMSLCPKLKTRLESIYSVLTPRTAFQVHLLGKTVSVSNKHSTCVAADVCNNDVFVSFGDSNVINLETDLKSIGIQYTKVSVRALGMAPLNGTPRLHYSKVHNVSDGFDVPNSIVWSIWANVDARLKWKDGDMFFNGEIFTDTKVRCHV